jgi:hypothetical protein
MALKTNKKIYVYDSTRTGESAAARRQASIFNDNQSSNLADMVMQYAGLVYAQVDQNRNYDIAVPVEKRSEKVFFESETEDKKRQYRVPFEYFEFEKNNNLENQYNFRIKINLNDFVDFERFKNLYFLRKLNSINYKENFNLDSWWLKLPDNQKIKIIELEQDYSGVGRGEENFSGLELNEGPALPRQAENGANIFENRAFKFDQFELTKAYENFLNFINGDFQSFTTPPLFRAAPLKVFSNLLPTTENTINYSANLLQQNYFDHTTNLNAPLTEKESNASNPSLQPLIFDVESNYNYYIESYESRNGIAFNTSLYSETELPNYYIIENLYNQSIVSFLEKYDYIKRLIFANNQIKGSFFENYSDYLKKTKKENPDLLLQTQFLEFGNNQKLIFINNNFGKTTQINKEYYPFYNNIKLTTYQNNSIVENLEKINSRFIKNLNISMNSVLTNKVNFFLREVSDQASTQEEISSNRFVETKTAIVDVLSVDNFLEMFNVYTSNSDVEFIQREVATTELFSFDQEEEEDPFSILIESGVLKQKIDNFVQDNKRSLFDILSGVEAASEILCFSVEKTNKATGTIEQQYFILNDSRKIINYIDTQVKYLKNYTYNLNAFILVAGMSYRYTDLNINSLYSLSNRAFYNQEFKPTIDLFGRLQVQDSNQIIKLNIANVDSLIADSPPLYPNVDFYFNPNEPRNVKMFFSPSGGEIIEEAKPIFSSDRFYYESILFAQNKKRNIQNNLIKFKTDDTPLLYEILKIDFEPSSYQDFSRGSRRLASTSIGSKRSDSTIFEEFTEINKPFYYTFRTIDSHGGMSNPSQIFKIINTYSEGALIPIVEEFNFKNNLLEPSKKFRRFIKIQPSIEQIYLSNNQFEEINNIEAATDFSLGLKEKSVFGKKFRAKIISKKTGKKVFIDFDFNLNKNKLFTYIRNQNQNSGGNN